MDVSWNGLVLSNSCGIDGFSVVSILFDRSMQYIICFPFIVLVCK